MLSESIPVFLNGSPARVPAGSTLADLVARERPDLSERFRRGLATATDGRGIAVTGDEPLVPGAIFRVFPTPRAGAGPHDA